TSNFENGQILEGKVTGIQPYGAFVALNVEIQGLVHISEVTHGYVKDINDHLSIGDNVKVKILQIDEENNKISLSIRATEEASQKQEKPKQAPTKQQSNES
ncbi:S1 domain-containing post-transcriptional regulator GSP13, partial [Virgibacillus salexigens]|uniref:S1 domain-containing post-transcriptional regulator GSP13 n=1 Tax=Virgibacillus salexigens TaxID=61016 RepID=UPI003081B003